MDFERDRGLDPATTSIGIEKLPAVGLDVMVDQSLDRMRVTSDACQGRIAVVRLETRDARLRYSENVGNLLLGETAILADLHQIAEESTIVCGELFRPHHVGRTGIDL